VRAEPFSITAGTETRESPELLVDLTAFTRTLALEVLFDLAAWQPTLSANAIARIAIVRTVNVRRNKNM